MPDIAKIDEFQFVSWEGDQLEPASLEIAIMEPPPKANGRGYVTGGEQAPFADPIVTAADAGPTKESAEALARQYRNLKNQAAGVTVFNSIGTRYDDVMIVQVRCRLHLNPVSGKWRVIATWHLDVGADEEA